MFAALKVAAATVIVAFVTAVAAVRFQIAGEASWRCDELPLLTQWTGLNGVAANEASARAFVPSLFSFRKGVIRSLRPPAPPASVQTSTAFWANLGLHVVGYRSLAARIAPWTWSIIAMLVAGWLAGCAARSLLAGCLAAFLMAVSPLASVYAAQARGYSEALASAGLVLVALEWMLRRPQSPWRIVTAAACLAHSATTVYTTWIYWALAALAIAWLKLRGIRSEPARRATRDGLLLTSFAALSIVGLYTLDRLDALRGQAEMMSTALYSWAELARLAAEFGRDVLGGGVWALPLAAVGAVAMARGPHRAWLITLPVCVSMMSLVTIATGNAGPVRSFLFLLMPLSVLSAVGLHHAGRFVVDGLSSACRRSARPRTAGAVMASAAALLALPVGAWGVMEVRRCTRAHLPDWGRAIAACQADTPADRLMWLCPCQGFRTVLDWYAPEPEGRRLWSLGLGQGLDVVLLTQRDAGGTARIFRARTPRSLLLEEALPRELARVNPCRVTDGVEERRWQGVRIHPDEDEAAGRELRLIVVATPSVFDSDVWRRISARLGEGEIEVVSFGLTPGRDPMLWSFIAPANAARTLIPAMIEEAQVPAERIRLFALQPISGR